MGFPDETVTFLSSLPIVILLLYELNTIYLLFPYKIKLLHPSPIDIFDDSLPIYILLQLTPTVILFKGRDNTHKEVLKLESIKSFPWR